MLLPHSTSSFNFFHRKHFIFSLFLILVFGIQGCTAQKNKKSVGPGGGEIEISQQELSSTMNDFFYRFERSITESADSIMKASPDPAVDKEALIWKMNSIPVANTAIYNSDPFLGYIDMAVFTYQMKLYFEKGAGRDLFGQQQDIAIGTVDSLWEDLLDIGRSLVPDNDISEGTRIVTNFAEQHPLTSSYFVRQSTIPLMTKIQNAEKVTFKRLAEDMSQSLDQMRAQLGSYMEVLPKQVRWESEFLIDNALTNAELNNRFDSISNLLKRTVLVLESSSDLIDNQRVAAFKDISGERIAIIQALRQEREIILEEFKKERAIILAELSEQINTQREASFKDLNALTNQSIDATFNRTEDIIDKLFWRTLILISILFVLIFIGLLLYKRI
ncbi:hypothetical protein C8P64_2598 [Christiangramia gaetbulicola]|uniref:Uncharacterized protein n=1 Tax=Christiangramia gaetbulicola TaxID=703340 RepID=A0A2T6AED4_9FLAO|nr:hypothetical protein [Christiangramia gaetbulicola]PTX42181.1 hypothetical protein C8P64_2598 [Christiangramia gaetbulicola]